MAWPYDPDFDNPDPEIREAARERRALEVLTEHAREEDAAAAAEEAAAAAAEVAAAVAEEQEHLKWLAIIYPDDPKATRTAKKARTEADTKKKRKVYRLSPAGKRAAEAFKQERDKGVRRSLKEFCREYAASHRCHPASYLERMLNGARLEWDPDGRYRRPQADT